MLCVKKKQLCNLSSYCYYIYIYIYITHRQKQTQSQTTIELVHVCMYVYMVGCPIKLPLEAFSNKIMIAVQIRITNHQSLIGSSICGVTTEC